MGILRASGPGQDGNTETEQKRKCTQVQNGSKAIRDREFEYAYFFWIPPGVTRFVHAQLHVVTSQFVMFIRCALRARIEGTVGALIMHPF